METPLGSGLYGAQIYCVIYRYVNNGYEFLILRRRKDGDEPEFWTLLGCSLTENVAGGPGSVLHRPLARTMRNHAFQKVVLKLESLRFMDEISFTTKDGVGVLSFLFATELHGGTPIPQGEYDDAIWITAAETHEYSIRGDEDKFIQYIDELLRTRALH